MSDFAIKVENLSKKYAINKKQDTLMQSFNHLFKKTKKEDFWALRDVSFEVKKGETIGIIGSNGAGKSTLLKILSKITPPTKGRATINGRVSSLLEVGTGFHPELTGRENIFLNGSLLGMTRAEIKGKLDEIIDFSGIEQFIDTPVKKYSSGMQVRLAFAVAAHLDPDIMLIDEVLAVGDVEFQRKCVEKINTLSKSVNRTILFISHNMSIVANLCEKTIIIKNGQAIDFGETNKVISAYLEKTSKSSTTFKEADLVNKIEFSQNQKELIFTVFYRSQKMQYPNVAIVISSDLGQAIAGTSTRHLPITFISPISEVGKVIFKIKDLNLMDGIYYLSIWVGEDKFEHSFIKENCLSFEIKNMDSSKVVKNSRNFGAIAIECEITHESYE